MAKSEVKVTYKVLNAEFNRGISEMNGKLTTLNKEFRLQQEQMKLTASNTEKLEATLSKLGAEYALAQEKTKLVAEGLKQVTQATGENSKETQTWSNKLLDAKKNEEFLKNAIEQTKSALDKERQAVSESARASQERKDKLTALKAEQDRLADSADKIRSKYDLERAALGNNAKESDLLKIKKKELAEQMENTGRQAQNLERQLEVAKAEYGESSREVDKLEKELLEAKTAFQEYANEAAKAGDKIGQFSEKSRVVGEKLTSVGKGLTAGLTVPIVAGAGFAVKAASDFESAFAGVMKTNDEVVDQNGKVVVSYDDLRDGIRKMAKEIPASTTEIAGVAEAAGQLGVKTENVLSFTRTMIDMGKSTNLSSEEAATALARLANITGLPQDKFDELGSTIVELGNNFATTESEIVELGLRLSSAGDQMGLTEAEILALSAAMSSVGLSAEAGGSAMSTVMTKINSAVHEGGEGLESFAQVAGLSAEQFAQKWKDKPTEALTDFVKGLGGVSASGENLDKVLKDLGITGLRETDTIKRLAGAGELLPNAFSMANKAFEENKALSEEAAKRYETFESKLGLVKNKVSDIAVEFGGPLMDAVSTVLDNLEPVFNLLSDLAQGFSNMPKPAQELVMIIGAILAAVGPVLIFVGQIATAIGAIGGLFAEGGALAGVVTWLTGTLMPALSNFVGAIVGWPLVISAAIAAVVAALVWFFTQTETGKQAWSDFMTWLTDLWASLVTTATEVWNGLVEVVGPAVDAVVQFVKSIWETFSTWWSENQSLIESTVKIVWDSIASYFTTWWSTLTAIFQAAMAFLEPFLSVQWELIKGTVIVVWELIKGHIEATITLVSGVIKAVMQAINGDWSGAWDTIKETGKKVLDIISTTVSNVFRAIFQTLSNIMDNIKERIGSAWESAKSKVTEIVNGIKDTIASGFESAKQTATNIFEGIKNTITNTINGAKDAVKRAIDTMRGFFNFSWSLPRPSLPRFSVSGGQAPWGFMGKGSLPSIGISWFAKGGIMTNPTVFGRNGNNLMAGGEAGPEAILPLTSKVLGSIGRAQAAAMGRTSGPEVTIHNTVNMTAQVDSDYGSDRLFNRVDQWLADKSSLRQFAVSGAN